GVVAAQGGQPSGLVGRAALPQPLQPPRCLGFEGGGQPPRPRQQRLGTGAGRRGHDRHPPPGAGPPRGPRPRAPPAAGGGARGRGGRGGGADARAAGQTRAVRSAEPVATNLPSGLTATCVTGAVCPLNRASPLPVATSQSSAWGSCPPVTICWPSGLKA